MRNLILGLYRLTDLQEKKLTHPFLPKLYKNYQKLGKPSHWDSSKARGVVN